MGSTQYHMRDRRQENRSNFHTHTHRFVIGAVSGRCRRHRSLGTMGDSEFKIVNLATSKVANYLIYYYYDCHMAGNAKPMCRKLLCLMSRRTARIRTTRECTRNLSSFSIHANPSINKFCLFLLRARVQMVFIFREKITGNFTFR